jgi:hypothetical protein
VTPQSASLPGEIRDRDRRQHHGREGRDREPREQREGRGDRGRAPRAAPLDLVQAMPLVERALQVLERRAVQPQLGLLKSTMLQLDPAFSEKAYGAGSFSDFVEKLKKADFVEVSGTGGRYIIERKGSVGAQPERATRKPEESLPLLRDVLEVHRLDVENGVAAEHLEQWMQEEHPAFAVADIGFQEFAEFLNYAQDKLVVRIEPDEEKVTVYLGAEFYPPALPEHPAEATAEEEEEEEEKQPIVPGQPSMFEPNPPPVPEPVMRKRAPRAPRTPRPRKTAAGAGERPRRQPRKKKTE